MKELPKKYVSTNHRKAMWADVKKVLKKVDKELDFKEIYVVGSMISNKKKPTDIDFAVVARVKSKKSNSAYPVDFIILPDNEDLQEYLDFHEAYMKKKHGGSFKPVKLK